MKIIAMEEHFTTEEHAESLSLLLEKIYAGKVAVPDEAGIEVETMWLPASHHHRGKVEGNESLLDNLLEVGEGRLRKMDEAGIDMQVLSLMMPGVQVLDAAAGVSVSRQVNDRLSEIVKNNPQRYAGLATIAPQAPEEAAQELERAVTKLGLKGTCINSHIRGEYLDDKKYWVMFEAAEKLNVPVYIHPRVPSPDMLKPYLAYPMLSMALWGYGAEVGLHAVRLMSSGLFDKYPRLKIMLGHLGEGLPFWLWRMDDRWSKSPMRNKLGKKPSEYFRDNFLATTSGQYGHTALACTLAETDAEKVFFATDYPFESSHQAVEFIKKAPISDDDKEKITHRNAEKLLGL